MACVKDLEGAQKEANDCNDIDVAWKKYRDATSEEEKRIWQTRWVALEEDRLSDEVL